MAFTRVRGHRADEQRHVMSARGKKVGEFRAEAARGKVREPAHVVERFEGRPGGDDAIHADQLTAKNAKNAKKIFPAGKPAGQFYFLDGLPRLVLRDLF